MSEKLSVYDHTDYRKFLKDSFCDIKKKNPRFSYRAFNRKAGFSSSAFLKLVMEGKRNLGKEGIEGMARGFGLGESETRYFEALVLMNQAKTHEKKDRYFREMAQNKGFLRAKNLNTGQYKLFSHWYYVAILEAVRLSSKGQKDVSWLHQILKPSVDKRKVREAVFTLEEMGFLVREKKGGYRRQEVMLTTPDEMVSMHGVNFHGQMSQLAQRSLHEDDPTHREFSALTIAVSPEAFALAKKETQEFRKKIHSILEQSSAEKKTCVVQMNFQIFKLTR